MKKKLSKRDKGDRLWERIGVAAGIFAILLIVGLVLWMRASAPCWIFPLAQAPSRCVVVGQR